MLQEDRSSVLASGNGGSGAGGRIVGSSLESMKDVAAKELFTMLAVVPEDVPVPLGAIELIWCAHTEQKPPLNRLAMMRVRSHVFSLLDRNLVLGETTSGVYMHDVVRDHSQSLAGGAAGLRGPQRAVVQLLIAAAPDDGWDPNQVADNLLTAYVVQSLRYHMSGAIEPDASRDMEALRWLETDAALISSDFVVQQACNVVGAAVLLKLAKAAEEGCGAIEKREKREFQKSWLTGTSMVSPSLCTGAGTEDGCDAMEEDTSTSADAALMRGWALLRVCAGHRRTGSARFTCG